MVFYNIQFFYIKEFINGAKQARLECLGNEFEDNISMQYAYARNLCYKAGKQVEAGSVKLEGQTAIFEKNRVERSDQ